MIAGIDGQSIFANFRTDNNTKDNVQQYVFLIDVEIDIVDLSDYVASGALQFSGVPIRENRTSAIGEYSCQ